MKLKKLTRLCLATLTTLPIQTVLADIKGLELGMGFSYGLDGVTTGLRAQRERSFSLPLSLKFDATPSLEASLGISMVRKANERVTRNDVASQSISGVGDATVGFVYQAIEAHNYWPDTSFAVSMGFPIGDPSDPTSPENLGTGSSARSVTVSAAFVKSSDPAVMFANIGLRHVYEQQGDTFTLQPGRTINYGFGAGFSINHNITFTGQIGGGLEEDTRFNGQLIAGTSIEPVSLTAGMTYRMSRAHRFETAVDFGLNDDASGIGLDLMYIRSFSR
jgi:hypothetical protein